MEEEQQLSFALEWYDPQSDQLKPYILHYHGDNTVEMIERYTKRIFLKRIRIPTVTLDVLVPGGSITVYSRQLTVVDAANEYTKQLIKRRTNRALFVIRPSGYTHMGKVVQVIEASGLSILNAVMAQLERSHVHALAQHCVGFASSDMDDLLRDVSVLVEVKQPTPNTLEDALGRLVASGLQQFVLMGEIGLSEVSTSGAKASGSSNGAMFPTTAVFDNCSLSLLRPRMLREGHVGTILDAILKAGFEISALKMIHFQMNDADEFFRVYKGIVRQYHEVLKYMCSGPCIALEIRGEDAVRRFREFCGPFDVQIAQALRPTSLRATLGKTNLLNAVHCTDCLEDGPLLRLVILDSVLHEVVADQRRQHDHCNSSTRDHHDARDAQHDALGHKAQRRPATVLAALRVVERQRDAERLVVVVPGAQARPAELLVALEALHVRAPSLLLNVRLAVRTRAHVVIALPFPVALVHASTEPRPVVVTPAAHARLGLALGALDFAVATEERLVDDRATPSSWTEAHASLLVLEERLVLGERLLGREGFDEVLWKWTHALRRGTHELLG